MSSDVEIVGEAARRADGWQNVLTGLGIVGTDHRLETSFARADTPLTDDQIEALYEEDAIFARIVDAIPKHATRRWVKFKADNAPDTFSNDVLRELDALDARQKFYDLLRLERLYGGSVMLIGANDGQKPELPLNTKAIKSIDYLNVFSRREVFVSAWDDDPFSRTFRRPKFYSFVTSGIAGMGQVHPSRIVRLTGIVTTERQTINNGGWGKPISSRVASAVRRFGTTFDYLEALLKDLVQGVVTIDGLNRLLSSDQGNQTLINRLRTMTISASAFRAVILDKTETYERRTIALGGLSDLILRVMDELAATAEMPLSVLFGQAPTGMSTDDTSGMRNFYDSIKNEQETKLRKPLRYVTEIVHAPSGVMPKNWDVDFIPLEEPNEGEEATTRYTNAQADDLLVKAAIISREEARSRLQQSSSNPYTLGASAPPEPPPPVAPVIGAPNGMPQKQAVPKAQPTSP